MKSLDDLKDSAFVFGSLLVIANKMDTLIERTMNKHGITAKQWFLLAILLDRFDTPPTMKELAKEMGSSHQNVKQVALRLEGKGLLRIEKDKRDLRATRLTATPKSHELWDAADSDSIRFLEGFYAGVGNTDMKNARLFLSRVMLNLESMENQVSDDER